MSFQQFRMRTTVHRGGSQLSIILCSYLIPLVLMEGLYYILSTWVTQLAWIIQHIYMHNMSASWYTHPTKHAVVVMLLCVRTCFGAILQHQSILSSHGQPGVVRITCFRLPGQTFFCNIWSTRRTSTRATPSMGSR